MNSPPPKRSRKFKSISSRCRSSSIRWRRLRPGGPNARLEGNVWVRPGRRQLRTALPLPEVQELKWTEEDFAEAKEGRLPMGKATDEWSFGDVEAGFKNAALVLDETFVTPNTSHQCLETRSAMAYWQNGKVYVHTGTQSTAQTVPAIARWLDIDPSKVVFISEYTGGGFGSKITGGDFAGHSRAAVEEGQRAGDDAHQPRGGALHRPRAARLHGRMKVGFAKEGRITALDMFVICDNGPYDPVGDADSSGRIVSLLYQPPAMRWRGVTVLTNTPPRSAQSSPGGMQGITLMEPVIAKAARKLGHRSGGDPAHQRAGRQSAVRTADSGGKRAYATSAFIKEALDRGAELFRWEERKAQSPQAERLESARRRRGDEHVRRRLHRLRRTVRHQARRPDLHPVGHRQSGHGVGERCPPRGRRDAGRAVGEVRNHLGQHGEESAVDLLFRRQPDHPRDDARGARGGDGCASRSCRRSRRRISAASPRITRSRTSACSARAAAPA